MKPTTQQSNQPTDSTEAVVEQLTRLVVEVLKSSHGPLLQITEKFDLTLSQLKMLFVLANSPEPRAVHELAGATSLSLPAAGRAVDSLCRGKFVTRREDAVDRRVKRVALTAKGEAATSSVSGARTKTLVDVVAQLSPAERTRFAAAMVPLLASLPNQCAEPAAENNSSSTAETEVSK